MKNQHIAKDILLGTAVGDALGFPVQFIPREIVRQKPVTGMAATNKWSDDTSLSLCLADSLCNGYNLNDIAGKFISWLYEGLWTPDNSAFDIGRTTMQAIINLKKGTPPQLAGLNREIDNGNGSLMRILPLVPYLLGLDERQQTQTVSDVSALTHRHPRSILSCLFLCKFALQYLHCNNLQTAFENTQQEIRQLLAEEKFQNEEQHFQRLVRLSYEQFKTLPEAEIKSTGYVIDTLEAALWCIFNNGNFKDSLLCAVNLGHDADTVGAITGALAGIVYGHHTIPDEWLRTLPRKDDILELADKLEKVL